MGGYNGVKNEINE